MGWMFDNTGRLITRLANHCEPPTPNDSTALRDTLRPGDVLLVERKGRISGSIKYLTQSTWSHSALYVGPMAGAATDGEPHVLIEANIDEGVVSAPLSKYLHCQTRICRPVGLTEADCAKVCRYASERIGLGYDFRNIIDLIKVAVPNMACQIIDWAIQVHGGGGTSNDFGLTVAYATARLQRLADGPDEVHRNQIARLELRKYSN